MSALDALLILLAGVGAGTINSIVGSGTLITFPTLLFLGYPPLMANVSNNIGMVAGGASASWGYRKELTGQGGALRRLMPMSLLGAILGAMICNWILKRDMRKLDGFADLVVEALVRALLASLACLAF